MPGEGPLRTRAYYLKYVSCMRPPPRAPVPRFSHTTGSGVITSLWRASLRGPILFVGVLDERVCDFFVAVDGRDERDLEAAADDEP
mmetsp:Transcript_4137/g.12869  ORF Transcript_4137/g.12869 Transcript_4137/m.12869 type:complete len:86 (+) Transcript_4137:437-694(+)